jgi:uncharacterized protein YdeI (YjbR/CyaY-like superfamily)
MIVAASTRLSFGIEDDHVTPVRKTPADVPIKLFEHREAWTRWLDAHHATSAGLWLRIAKKESSLESVSYAEALEVALCYGWIDGQKKSHDDSSWLQKFTPRGPRSIWSKINRQKAEELVRSGRMKPTGLEAVESAKRDGRWEAAYDSPGRATVPRDLQVALNESAAAKAFFATLDSRNRYAILFRVHTAKKAETRAKRIAQFVRMLEKGEKIYP